MSRVLRIASRPTELALRRARAVQAMLAARQLESEVVPLRTEGDKRFEEPFRAAAARTLFTHELEVALLKGRADLAVHALPDVETESTPGLAIRAVLSRDDPRDVLVLNRLLEGTPIAELPRGTSIGTSSVRCRALLQAIFPDLEVVHLRGDLPTRLRKVDEGQVHGTIVPAEALRRLDVSQRIAAYLEPPEWLPTPGQGTTVIQTREDADDLATILASLNDERSATDTAAERAFLTSLEGGLQSPVGALVLPDGEARVLHGVIVDPRGRQLLRGERALDDAQPELVGVRLANELRGKGASSILDAIRGMERIPAPQPDS